MASQHAFKSTLFVTGVAVLVALSACGKKDSATKKKDSNEAQVALNMDNIAGAWEVVSEENAAKKPDETKPAPAKVATATVASPERKADPKADPKSAEVKKPLLKPASKIKKQFLFKKDNSRLTRFEGDDLAMKGTPTSFTFKLGTAEIVVSGDDQKEVATYQVSSLTKQNMVLKETKDKKETGLVLRLTRIEEKSLVVNSLKDVQQNLTVKLALEGAPVELKLAGILNGKTKDQNDVITCALADKDGGTELSVKGYRVIVTKDETKTDAKEERKADINAQVSFTSKIAFDFNKNEENVTVDLNATKGNVFGALDEKSKFKTEGPGECKIQIARNKRYIKLDIDCAKADIGEGKTAAVQVSGTCAIQ